ncbi:MAG: UPF0182 family protein [Actinobacteria bacterium]|nr:UPF0182 family protein [Actinomycetota bacterium]
MSSLPLGRTRRGALIPTLIIVLVLAYLFASFAQVWTDKLWFGQLGYGVVFSTQLWTSVGLFLGFGLIMALAVGGTLVISTREIRGAARSSSALLNRYRDLLGRRVGLAVAVPAAFFGIMAGITGTSAKSLFLAYLHHTTFGTVDPRFGLDISFFVFEYPWYRYLNSFALGVLLLCLAIAVVVNFAMGVLSAQTRPGLGNRRAHQQISVLAGLALVSYGVSAYLDRFGEELQSSSLLDGLTYTGDHAQITAHTVVAVISLLTAIAFFVYSRRPGWRIPVTSAILMVVSSIIVGVVYPSVVQSFSVKPDEPDKERPYVQSHIAATRDAYGVADTQIYDYSATTSADAGQLSADAATLPGIRLIDPSMVRDTYEQLQQVRGYYSFAPVLDVDRYSINGTMTDVVIAAREMDQSGLTNKQWNNLHTVYTHGYGLVAAYGNRRQAGGEPQWLAADIPTVGLLKADQPRIYYGELAKNYVVVGRTEGQAPIEFDTPGGGGGTGEQFSTYDGEGGVGIGNVFTKALYAMRFADVNLLLSDRVKSSSKILYERTPTERIQQVAPWLTVDSDIYPAIVKGRVVWIVDAYTTTDNYPNSHKMSMTRAASNQAVQTGALQASDEVNYVRNSVKATIDAYDGSVKLYAWDETDPLLQTWMKVYPGTVQPKSAISPELLSHLRYPTDLYRAQREVLARYHMTNPDQWYSTSDMWAIPSDPTVDQAANLREPTYYMSVRWPTASQNGKQVPGETSPQFSQTTVYSPNARQNLAAYMTVVADASSKDYGKIRVLRMSDTQQIEGAGQAHNNILRDEKVASALRPYLNQGSAKALYANLLTVPVGGGILYVEPIYTQRNEAQSGAFPVLTYVVVRFGDHVGIADTLQGALDQVFSGDAGATTNENAPPTKATTPSTTTTPGAPTAPDEQTLKSALAQAQQAFSDASKALASGDLAGYQKANDTAQAAVARALKAMGG